ncbi:MAG: hypothetical protein K6T81_14040 [Alicyclobacillus macrosporangiidus]|uniref:hypothetical protein n=1 Tax=Alicyclobacillus macrosporangiidus TaxID=392015 RepID=UPI0026EE5D21|nr:hypothetical protein [Alicyclobacillus macrosporangiidus]MCL6599837.1 hypothetical protein [Alicyclobacillus macrosporangiidus]
MKRWMGWMSVLSVMVLAACGPQPAAGQPGAGHPESNQTAAAGSGAVQAGGNAQGSGNAVPGNGTGTAAGAGTVGAGTAAGRGTAAGSRPSTQVLRWTAEGNPESATARLYRSDNQQFSMYVLPECTASAEEPGRDVVLFQPNAKVFMRVQRHPAGTSVDTIRKQVEAQLKAVATPQVVRDDGSIPFLSKAIHYVAYNQTDTVEAVIFQSGGAWFTATVYAPREFEGYSRFFAMMETIQPEEV